jgi:hypothetical protein
MDGLWEVGRGCRPGSLALGLRRGSAWAQWGQCTWIDWWVWRRHNRGEAGIVALLMRK